jgi:hypothetical protein
MSSTTTCSASPCTNAGTRACTGCTAPAARYCSKECQKRDWKRHKVGCASAQTSNCYLIRDISSSSSSSPSNSTDDWFDIAPYVESFSLQDYGTEKAEKAELKRRLGWTDIAEVGKFYDHKGSDTWYYYVYGPHPSSLRANTSPLNEVASLCCYETVCGDVAVVRSGPADSTVAEEFTKAELVRTLEFYRTRDPNCVFGEREKSRACRKFGFNPAGVPHAFVVARF